MTDTCRASHADMNAEPWEAAVDARLPVLLTGPGSTTGDWIHHMRPQLALPVLEVACDAGLKTAALNDAATVILHDVDRLHPRDQQRLVRWLEKAPPRPQVISTSMCALYPMVGAGRFSQDLYYRLNVVYLDCRNPTIIDLGVDEGGWIGEFPAEDCVDAAAGLAVPSVGRALLSIGRIQLALASCALGVVIGAASMWVVAAQAQSAVVPVASGAGTEGNREPPTVAARQQEVPSAAVQLSLTAGVPSSGAAMDQAELAAVAPTVQRAPARPRRTVFRGALAVNSRPTGARVSINGRPLGVTPLTVKSLPAGSRVVRLTAQGYHPWSSAVRVVANQRNSVMATLQRLPD